MKRPKYKRGELPLEVAQLRFISEQEAYIDYLENLLGNAIASSNSVTDIRLMALTNPMKNNL